MAIASRALDFTNVKDMGSHNPKRIPAGDYRGRVTKVEESTSKQGNEQWVFTIVTTAATGGGSYPYYCGFDIEQMWKIRNLLIAGGFQIPKKKVRVDPQKLVGKEIGMTMEDDEYNDREKSKILAVFPAEDLAADTPDGEIEPDEEPEAKPATTRRTTTARKATPAKKATPPPADDDEAVDGDDEEMDIEEI